jgi:hypothetical protein
MSLVDRGSKLDRAYESLERAEAALDRARGTMAEQDWRAHVDRQLARVMALEHGVEPID